MTTFDPSRIYDFSGKNIVITGGAGILCSQIAGTLADCGARVFILDLKVDAAQESLAPVKHHQGGYTLIAANVLETDSLNRALDEIRSQTSRIDALINGAGGNKAQATTSPDLSFFKLPTEALKFVFDLNLLGTILPCQVFGTVFAQQKSGNTLNISSMNAFRPLTRIPAYSAAKSGVSNFTQWLAVHMAQEYAPEIRVNAIAPGFFLTDQNRFLLTDARTGQLSERGQKIIAHTPMGRFGDPQDLIGAVLWPLSPAAAFVTGVVLPIDGGFSAYSGV